MLSRKAFGLLLTGIAGLNGLTLPRVEVSAPPVEPSGAFYFAPAATGNGSGSSYGNAAPISQLASIVNANGSGDYYIIADQGDYTVTGQSPIANLIATGAPLERIRIRGVNSLNQPTIAKFVGTRTAWTLPANPEQSTDVRGWTPGEANGFTFQTGAECYTFTHLRFERFGRVTPVPLASESGDYGQSVFYLTAGQVANDVVIQDVEAHNIRRFIDSWSTTGSNTASWMNLFVDRVAVTGFSKQCFRFRGNSADIVVQNFNLNSGRLDGDRFAQGFQIEGAAHDVRIEGSTIPGQFGLIENCHDQVWNTSGDYWNGDGISVEETQYNITIIRVHARGHTDSGFDIKMGLGYGLLVQDCIFEQNKRNGRLWGPRTEFGVFINCIFRLPNNRGGIGGCMHLWQKGGAAGDQAGLMGTMTILKGCTLEGTGTVGGVTGSMTNMIQSDGEDAACLLVDCTVSNPDGAPYSTSHPSSKIFLDGTASDTTPPVITSPTTLTQVQFLAFQAQLTASDTDVVWRITNDPSGVFSINGNVLKAPASAANDLVSGRNVTVRCYDKHGNFTTQVLSIDVVANPAGPGVVMHATFDGTNGGTSFTEAVGAVGAPTFKNTATLSNAQTLTGATSLRIPNSSSGITFANNDLFDLPSVFAVRIAFRLDSLTTANRHLIGVWGSGGSSRQWILQIDTSNVLRFLYSPDGTSANQVSLATSAVVTAGAWHEAVVSRDASNVIRVFYNGTLVLKTTVATAFFAGSTVPLSISGLVNTTNGDLQNGINAGYVDLVTIWRNTVPVQVSWDGGYSGILPTNPSPESVNPTITSASSHTIADGATFSLNLTANEPVVWSIVAGGDADDFTMSGSTLSMTTRSHASPTDADANNIYSVTVRATDVYGNSSTQVVTVTVSAPVFNPVSLFQPGDKGALFDISNLSTMWQDLARTLPAAVNQPVRIVDDLSGRGNHIIAPSDAARPILRQSGSFYYLDADGADDEFRWSDAGLDITRNIGGLTISNGYRFKSATAATGWIMNHTTTAATNARAGVSRNSAGTLLVAGGRRLNNNSFAFISTSNTTAVQVATALFDFANSDIFLRRGGALVASSTAFQTDGTTEDSRAFSGGVFSTGAGTGLLDGEWWGGIIISRILTPTEIANMEAWLAARNGAPLA